MRHAYLLSIPLALVLATAHAQSVKKCVDDDGNVTFLQGDCPKSEAQQDIVIHPENRDTPTLPQFPEPTGDGLEWVWVASVLDSNDGGIVVREGGDAYLIESGHGCASLWTYRESFAQVFAPGEFGEPGSLLLLRDHEQRCALHAVKPLPEGQGLARPAPAVPVAPPAADPEPPRSQPAYAEAEPIDEHACRRLRREYKALNVRCRGLDECNRKRSAIDGLKRRWADRGCEGALGIGPY